MEKLIYLIDDFNMTIERILQDRDLEHCGLTKENVGKTLISFGGDEMASIVFYKKYALRDEKNKIIEFTLSDSKKRWAKAMVSAEKGFNNEIFKDELYFEELYDYFFPGGRQMFGLGNDTVKNVSYTNCYATKIQEDSIEGIFDVASKIARTYSYGGGIGFCLGDLRPKKSKVSNTSKISTGSVSFMELFSLTTGLIGQCIAKGQRVLTRRGLIKIEDISLNDWVWTKIGFVKVLNKISNGKKKILKLKDEFGNEIFTSPEHTFLVESSGQIIEKRLCEMEVGSNVILIPGTIEWERNPVELINKEYVLSSYNNSNRLNVNIILPNILEKDLAYVLGYSYGDGGVQYDKHGNPESMSLSCSNDYPEIKIKIKDIIKRLFNYDVKINRGDGNLETLDIYSKIILKFLKDNNLLKQKAFELIFPEKILECSADIQLAFIAGYYDADGRIGGPKNGYKLSSVCYSFLKQTKDILLSCGILTRDHFEYRENMGWRNLHSFVVVGAYFQEMFINLMRESLKVKKNPFIAKRDVILTPFNSKILNIKYNNYNYVPGFGYNFSANCYNKIKKESAAVLPNMLIKSQIVSIEENGECDTYDLTLEKEHVFYCEGFEVHNSGRRGALLLSMPVNHPDIEDFIEIKHNNIDSVKFANISIKITDDFMKAVINDENFELCFNTHHETITRIVRAKELWNKIIKSARDSAEPGLLFWDNIKNDSPSDIYEQLKVVCTNPCGELPLSFGGSCVLGSLLLHNFVDLPFTENAKFNVSLFKEMVKRSVRHLDNVVELNIGKHPLKEQEDASVLSRRIGLGITGLADMFACLNLKYDSEEALDTIKEIMKIKMEEEYKSSIELAKERGSFALFNPDLHYESGFCKKLPEEIKEMGRKYGQRNVGISTVAPSGSISIIAQCSSGIEPIFALSYKRTTEMGGQKSTFTLYHPGMIRSNFINDGFNRDVWVVAHDIDYNYRIKLQKTIQYFIDASISSTINLPSNISEEVVGQLYINAWKEGLKGITVYREGSREGILVSDNYIKEMGMPNMDTSVHCVRAEGGDKFYIIISYENKDITKPFQVFVMNYKKTESDAFVKIGNGLYKMLKDNGVSEERLSKYASRSNNSLVKMTRFLSLSMKTGNLSLALKILDENAFVGTLSSKLYDILGKSIPVEKFKCPNCGSENIRTEEGCVSCLDCNWSRCH